MEQKNELYHYGRKGMKWGKNIFSKEDLKRLWDKRITGEHYLNKSQQAINRKINKQNSAAGVSTGSDEWHRTYSNMRSPNIRRINLHMDRQQRKHDNYAEAAKRAGKASNYYYKQYRTQSLKGIAESKTQQAKNWISSRPQVIKKKVSDIKDKIAKAESGKKTVTYPLSRDANKKKTKKSTIKSSSHYMSNY